MSMLKSSEPHVVQAGARQISLAALWVDEARGDEAVVLEMGEEARAGAATVYAGNLSDQTVGADCEKHLRTLFEDESDLVRREASSCWVHLQPDQIASRGSLIGAFAHSLDSARDVSLLAYRLKDARRPLPAEVCVVAERALNSERGGWRCWGVGCFDGSADNAFSSQLTSCGFWFQGDLNSERGGWRCWGVGCFDGSASRADQ